MDSQCAYPGRGLATAMLLAVVLGACSNAQTQTPAPAPQLPEVSVVTVHRHSVPITTKLPGRTSAYLVAQVRARVDGIVLKREFKEGSEVKMGQRLYQIDPARYIAALNSAQASVGCRDGKVRSADGLVDLLDAYSTKRDNLNCYYTCRGGRVCSARRPSVTMDNLWIADANSGFCSQT
jgi:multidrug efflux pump subunit AcrA (membrane-fusion protein)